MTGTIIITGANGSIAIPAVQHLLANYQDFTAVLTVRDSSDNDINTKTLRTTIPSHPGAKTSIREVDLADLSAVHDFATSIAADIAQDRLPPLASIVCNAAYWNLYGAAEITKDGYDKTFQVVHVAHAVLVLRLLGSFGPDGGRVVLFSSDGHYPGKNSLEKYPPAIPNDLELLVKPAADDPPDNFGRGFQRYAVSKLAVTTWMYALNRYLKKVCCSPDLLQRFRGFRLILCKDPKLRNITAVAMNPGNCADSRALRTRTPRMLVLLSIFVIRPLRPLLRFMDPTIRTSAEAGTDVIDLATEKAHPHERGYFTLLEKDASAPESMDEAKQQALWKETLQWPGITRASTALTAAFE